MSKKLSETFSSKIHATLLASLNGCPHQVLIPLPLARHLPEPPGSAVTNLVECNSLCVRCRVLSQAKDTVPPQQIFILFPSHRRLLHLQVILELVHTVLLHSIYSDNCFVYVGVLAHHALYVKHHPYASLR